MEIIQKLYLPYGKRGLKCDGCNLGEDYFSDGIQCYPSRLYFHNECANSDLKICSIYHPQHSLEIKLIAEDEDSHGECKVCRGNLPKMYYSCIKCDFAIDLICARTEVKIKIEGSKVHEHQLSLVPEMIMFTCHLCGVPDDRFPYVCNLCDLSFHKDCAESAPDLNYSCHPKHPLKRLTSVPKYSDEKCCLCGKKFHIVFYHCSTCNFSVDINCAKNAPPFTHYNSKAHEHILTLMPQRSFICNACGIGGETNPYVCSQCNFMIHKSCIDTPRVIKINRHNHRIYYKHFLDVGDWRCGVCHKEINWTCGAYSCLKCSQVAFHLRCATKFGVWDGIDLEGRSEDTQEVQSYEVLGEGLIKHFGHEEHALNLKQEVSSSGLSMWCKICTYPLYNSSFYTCKECDDFIIHQKCAYLPKKKIDPIYKQPIRLIDLKKFGDSFIGFCYACQNVFKGFMYVSDNSIPIQLDVRCGSISEPFFHESHPLHPLYINYLAGGRFCYGCGDKATTVLSCEECGFFLDIKCSTLPKTFPHKHDEDHFMYLTYGGTTSDQYWCEVCEEELNPKQWFYSCDPCSSTIHIKCTLGDFLWIKPRGKAEGEPSPHLILNNRLSRPICFGCGSRCQFPSIMNFYGNTLCSLQCMQKKVKEITDK